MDNNLNETFLKDVFSDLTDDGWKFTISTTWGIEGYGIKDTARSINVLIKRFLKFVPYTIDDVSYYKISSVNISKKGIGVMNFKEFKDFNLNLISRIPIFCDYLDIDEKDIKIHSDFIDEYNITFIKKGKKIKNLKKFSRISTSFNSKFNGLISISLDDDGIKLSVQGNKKNIKDLVFLRDKRDVYDEAINILKKDFTIEYKDDYVYLQPKFEFIINE